MAALRTTWHFYFRHFYFRLYLGSSSSRLAETREEVSLSKEPLRMDYLLLTRTTTEPIEERPDLGLRGLWPRLTRATVMELKTVSRGYRRGDLDQLWAYAHLYQRSLDQSQSDRSEVGVVLLLPARTPSLNKDVDLMNLRWEDLGDGYWAVRGGLFQLLVVEIDRVCVAENDHRLRLFSSHKDMTEEGLRYWTYMTGTEGKDMALQDMEDYDEVLQRLLSGLKPEQRLQGLKPEEIRQGTKPEQLVLALPDEALRGLSEDFLATLPEETRAEIRRRLGH